VKSEKRKPRLIVSMTSYPGRMSTIRKTLDTLLVQTREPDEIVLWLGEDKFPNRLEDLPDDVRELCPKRLAVRWCRDLRSYTKLIPALKEYPDDVIVTVDDDVLYAPDMLERMWRNFLRYPRRISANRVHRMRIGWRTIAPYMSWEHRQQSVRCCLCGYEYLLTGVGGVLYPPHVFDKGVFDLATAMRVSPRQDDLWFWAWAVMSGVKICNVPGACVDMPLVDGSQETSLYSTNIVQNDVQLSALLDEYPLLRKRLPFGWRSVVSRIAHRLRKKVRRFR